MNRIMFFLLYFLFNCASGETSRFQSSKIDLEKYLGLWYEFARTPNEFQDNEFKENGNSFSVCYNTTATYSFNGVNSIRLENLCVRDSKNGLKYKEVQV